MVRRSWDPVRALITGAVVVCAVAACAGPTENAGRGDTRDGSTIVLADSYEDEALNPLLGYAQEGASKIFDGLVSYDAQRRMLPALAERLPTPAPDLRSWTVTLREGVRFHDGSTLGAEDVVATYRALIDPARGSTVRSDSRDLAGVTQLDPRTVRFELKHPSATLPSRLTMGILPSEALAGGGPLLDSPVNSRPVGTGPYKLAEWRRGTSMTLVANADYWGGPPTISKIVVVFAVDDNIRAQRMRSGEFDGTVLPPALADTFVGGDYRVLHHRTADYRTITMPSGNPVTADPAIRLALNYAVDRPGMIDALLAGHGVPAYSPIPPVLGEYVEPAAGFRFDRAEAARILDAAGWLPGPDGIRVRDGQRAQFTLMYSATDSVRKDLAQAFTSDARAAGIAVALAGLGWEAIEPRMGADAVVLGGGNPFDPEIVSYPLLHSSYSGDGFNNPGSYRNPEVDAALDAARAAPDTATRVAELRRMQREYTAAPGFVFLAFLDHSYVTRDDWTGYQEVVEPHTHGTTWGPWWNVERWVPKK
ncbi:ABC transporter substrate-binding protein [Pseudonocardia eucalypti]|uniref:ABC transporter substrate-binding protein n=1 Tax=Pseudonocardia eucalypti TaxID=648755 RepID=A0ABP9QVT1_9PSEU|nr:peptide/nickel transport system substrate-binding protein [Pseudonocardia eucalypti]